MELDSIIILLSALVLAGGCPPSMLAVKDVCLEWNNEDSVDYSTAHQRCLKNGGTVASVKTGLQVLNQMPRSSYDQYAKHQCYWLGDSKKMYISGSALSAFISMFSAHPEPYGCSHMCYKAIAWREGEVKCDSLVPYICRYKLETFQISTQEPDSTTNEGSETFQRSSQEPHSTRNLGVTSGEKPTSRREVRYDPQRGKEFLLKGKNSYVVGRTLLDEPASVVTMCLRICRDVIECTMFNYNRVTKRCRGFNSTAVDLNKQNIYTDWEMWTSI